VTFAAGLSEPADPDKLIVDSMHALYSVELPPQELQFIKTNILLSGLVGMASDHYWTNAWTTYQEHPDDKTAKNTVTNKLKALYRHLMDMPEYQLM
jgi:hypothetical protein